jgi:hypothetical protein
MNRISKFFIPALLISNVGLAAERVERSETWTDSFEVTTDKPSLEIDNIWGDINVRPGKPGEIRVTIAEHRSAPDQKRFDRSLETLPLNIETDEDGVIMYVGHPDRDWHGWQNCRGCEVNYRFEVVVPVGTQLNVSTVNDGNIDIAGIKGNVSADNVNGSIAVTGLYNCEEMNSINGEVDLDFKTRPVENCNISTINGDITLKLPGNTGMDVAMDLFNGRMVSQLPVDPLSLPAKVEHREENGRHQYLIEQHAGVRIGAGGPTFTISSMNGDIQIQKTN